MARVSDVVCAVALGPAGALLAILAGVLVGTLASATSDTAILSGVAIFVALPPATILLRARVRGLAFEWTCLLLVLTMVSMAATLSALVLAMSLAYAHFMGSF